MLSYLIHRDRTARLRSSSKRPPYASIYIALLATSRLQGQFQDCLSHVLHLSRHPSFLSQPSGLISFQHALQTSLHAIALNMLSVLFLLLDRAVLERNLQIDIFFSGERTLTMLCAAVLSVTKYRQFFSVT